MKIENIIIGAGLAGLYCAWQLHMQGRDFILLEANDKAGGRIASTVADYPVDVGPTWFWPHQHNMQNLIQELGLQKFEQYTAGDTLFQPKEEGASIQKMQYQQGLSYRVEGGTEEIIKSLESKLPHSSVQYCSPVNSIRRVENDWVITTNVPNSDSNVHQRATFKANNLFIAVPPRMIVAHLTPEHWLSNNAIEHLKAQQTWMSAQAKYVAVFDKPYWRDEGYSGFAISHKGPLVEIHDASMNDQFALFGFIGVPAQHRMKLTYEQLKQACRQQLREIFGLPVPVFDAVKDWSKDSYISTNWDINESPHHSHINLELLKTENAWFVGSEYSQSEPGYMEGAIDAVDVALASWI